MPGRRHFLNVIIIIRSVVIFCLFVCLFVCCFFGGEFLTLSSFSLCVVFAPGLVFTAGFSDSNHKE